jgi:hypothetical protein
MALRSRGRARKELLVLPSVTHPESVPFLLVRASSDNDDDPETLPDVAKAVRPRKPPPRTNVEMQDLPSVIIELPPPPLPLRVRSLPADPPNAAVDGGTVRIARSDLPIDAKKTAPAEARPRKGKAARVVIAGLVAIGALGALGATGKVTRVIDVHRLNAAIPRAVVGLLHR